MNSIIEASQRSSTSNPASAAIAPLTVKLMQPHAKFLRPASVSPGWPNNDANCAQGQFDASGSCDGTNTAIAAGTGASGFAATFSPQ